MNAPQTVSVLGATGSIGVNTLDVLARHPARFSVYALSAARNVDKLFEQCRAFRPRYAVMVDEAAARALRGRVEEAGLATEVLAGPRALVEVASHPEVDTVVAAIVGAAGLPSALAAAHAGKRILLANKETLVVAGSIFMEAVHRGGATLLPVDSEHNAIFQALPRDFAGDLAAVGVRSLWLTASGGPFRTAAKETMARATPEQACAHPNWVMGRKISVDSATMMNKGLEVIEAHWLFNARADQIRVLVHPQSVVHSLVEYRDGSVLAQLGTPDMRTPIAYALGFPERIAAGVDGLDLFRQGLSFEAPDLERFPCLRLAYRALESGGAAAAVLNAANEEAVDAFLARRCGFGDIAATIETVLDRVAQHGAASLEELLDADRAARAAAREFLDRLAR